MWYHWPVCIELGSSDLKPEFQKCEIQNGWVAYRNEITTGWLRKWRGCKIYRFDKDIYREENQRRKHTQGFQQNHSGGLS